MANNFDQDVKLGEAVQRFLLKELKEEFPTLASNEGGYAEYDLCDESGYTIEVKFDYKSLFTGNTAIEYLYKNNPSGISNTTAIEWIQVYYCDNWGYSRVSVNNLRAYLRSNWDFFTKLKGGDHNKSNLVLIDAEQFATDFEFIHIDNKS